MAAIWKYEKSVCSFQGIENKLEKHIANDMLFLCCMAGLLIISYYDKINADAFMTQVAMIIVFCMKAGEIHARKITDHYWRKC